MKIVLIEGSPKEIAALMSPTQGQRTELQVSPPSITSVDSSPAHSLGKIAEELNEAIQLALLSQSKKNPTGDKTK